MKAPRGLTGPLGMLLPGICMGVMPPGVPPAPSSSPALFVFQPGLERQGPHTTRRGRSKMGTSRGPA